MSALIGNVDRFGNVDRYGASYSASNDVKPTPPLPIDKNDTGSSTVIVLGGSWNDSDLLKRIQDVVPGCIIVAVPEVGCVVSGNFVVTVVKTKTMDEKSVPLKDISVNTKTMDEKSVPYPPKSWESIYNFVPPELREPSKINQRSEPQPHQLETIISNPTPDLTKEQITPDLTQEKINVIMATLMANMRG